MWNKSKNEIDLKNQNLRFIDPKLLGELILCKKLFLSNNNIKTIQNIRTGNRLELLDLSYNQI